MPFRFRSLPLVAVLQPRLKRFGLLPLRSPLLGESLLISFPWLLRWFTSPCIAPPGYVFAGAVHAIGMRVAPFGNPGVDGCSLLAPDFRGLPRPSSPCGSTGIRHGPVFAWPYCRPLLPPLLRETAPSRPSPGRSARAAGRSRGPDPSQARAATLPFLDGCQTKRLC